MDLLQRYLQAVKFFLPRNQQDDIIRELSENLISEIEDRQEELGRTLNESEVADILKRHGHPMLVAGRYRSRQQLIGPVFFPMYLFALKIGFVAALVVTVVVAIVTAAVSADSVQQAVNVLLGFPGRALMVFAWTTLVFALLDFAQASMKLSGSWDPRSLPKLVRPELQIPRGRTLCEFIFTILGVGWLLLVPRAPFLIVGPAAAFVDFAPVWSQVYVPILLIAVATAVLHGVNFVHPYWTRTRSLARVAINVANLAVLSFLINAGEWFVRKATLTVTPENVQLDRLVEIINIGFRIGFAVAAVFILVEIVREVYRFRSRSAVSVVGVLSS